MYTPVMVFAKTMAATEGTITVNLPQAYQRIYCEVPTLSTSAELQVFGSADGTTYHQVFHPVSSGVAAGSMLIGSGLGSNGGIAEIAGHFKYVRIVASAAPTAAAAFVFHCS